MSIHLSSFEQEIDESNLERGLSLFSKVGVELLPSPSQDVVEAQMHGRNPYRVSLRIEGDEVTGYRCDCHQNQGSICPHEVALMFHLSMDRLSDLPEVKKIKKKQEKELESQGPTAEVTKSAKKKKAPKTLEDRMREVVDPIAPDALKVFVIEMAVNNISFRDKLQSEFQIVDSPTAHGKYRTVCRRLVREHIHVKSHVYDHEMMDLEEAYAPHLEKLDICTDQSRYEEAYYRAVALLDPLVGIYALEDECLDRLVLLINPLLEAMATAIDTSEDKRMQAHAFKFLYSLLDKQLEKVEEYIDVPSLAQLLVGAQRFVGTKKQLETETLLHSKMTLYPLEFHWAECLIAVIGLNNGEQAAQTYLSENGMKRGMADLLLDRFLSEDDYVSARRLAQALFDQVELSDDGEKELWAHVLFELAVIEKDAKAVTKYAKWLILHATDYNKKMVNEQLMAANPGKRKNRVFKELQSALSSQEPSRMRELRLVSLYVFFDKKDALEKKIWEHLGLDILTEMEPVIDDLLPGKKAAFYKALADREMRTPFHYTEDYQEMCRIMRGLRYAGDKALYEQAINDLRGLHGRDTKLMHYIRSMEILSPLVAGDGGEGVF